MPRCLADKRVNKAAEAEQERTEKGMGGRKERLQCTSKKCGRERAPGFASLRVLIRGAKSPNYITASCLNGCNTETNHDQHKSWLFIAHHTVVVRLVELCIAQLAEPS